MASNKLGTLIKSARAEAGLTQEQLARKIAGLSASDISLAERGQKDLTQAQIKEIAKATGVTQASLLNAAKETSTKSTSSKTTAAKKTTTTKKTATTKSSSASSSKSSTTSIKVTASEKKILELYRKADAETRKAALGVLKGEDKDNEFGLDDILGLVQDILGSK